MIWGLWSGVFTKKTPHGCIIDIKKKKYINNKNMKNIGKSIICIVYFICENPSHYDSSLTLTGKTNRIGIMFRQGHGKRL